jgi:UDP-N-acetyl-D-glucosamine dehydrogenase
MPEWIVEKLNDALNSVKKSINGSRILVLGIAYKKNVDDMRESPAVAIMEILRTRGAEVAYSDPHVPVFPKMREHNFELNSVVLNPKSIASYDAVVLTTNHDLFNYQEIASHARLVIDSRGVYRTGGTNIVKA